MIGEKAWNNDWLFRQRFDDPIIDRFGNSITTLERDQAEVDVREWYRNRRGRSMLTEWSDLAEPLELAGINDWGVRSVRRGCAGGAEPS